MSLTAKAPADTSSSTYFGVAGAPKPACVPKLEPGRESTRIFTEGDELFDAMVHSVARARRHIWLESYIFAADAVGLRFADALCERARAGVDVRVHVDSTGSLFWGFERLVPDLRTAGVKVKWFNPWRWRWPFRYNHRNHRKLLVLDGREAYLGGFNIHRESSSREFGRLRWRDTHVRIEGELARQAASLFEAMWAGDRKWMPEMPQRTTSVLMTNHTRRCRHVLSCIYLDALATARSTIYITTPYFMPSESLQRRMIDAAQAGIDVRLLVPARVDVGPVRWASGVAYRPLLREGVRIFGYGPRLLHAKTIVIDGDWTSIGTANMDNRSLFLNDELTLVSRDPCLGAALHEQFLADLASSRELPAVPRRLRSPTEYLLGVAAWLLRRWL